MSHSLDPGTHLQMSLEVDRIHQLRSLHNLDAQGLISQQLQNKYRKNRNQVKSGEKSESVEIDTNDEKSSETNQKDNTSTANQKDQQSSNIRGEFIDYKI